MRHLVGVILAAVLAAAVFFAASWAWLKIQPAPLGATSLIHHHRVILEAIGALAGVGLLAGLLMALPWVSPLASGLPGLALLGWTALYLFDVPRALNDIPLRSHPYGAGFSTLLQHGLLGLAGAAMIVPLFVPSRWRRRRAAVALASPEGSFPGLQATQTMATDSGVMSDWAETRPQQRIDPNGPPPSQAPWGPAEYHG
jgi:hypothetical protein